MMGYIWLVMLLLSVLSACLQGSPFGLTVAAFSGAQEAISLCISLAGALCLWTGLAHLMEKAGLTRRLGRLLQPVFRRLFPVASKDPLAMGYLTANVSANLLGLGNAATPMGIAAVKRMQELSGRKEVAGDEMCLLIVMNTASIQLLPTTVASVRASCGAAAPFDILPAVWLTSVLSVTMGIAAARFLRRFYA